MKIDPQMARLEASTICQLKCCGVGQGKETIRGKGFLKIDDFKKFIKDNPRIKQIELAGHAEIFLNPDLFQIIQYAYEKKIRLTANVGVNLNYLTAEMAETLVKYKFRSILCAIDGASQETYKIYRVGGDFNKVIENIKKINFFKRKYRSKFPLLHWQFVIFGHNEHEIPLAKNMAEQLNMSFLAHLAWDNTYPLKDKDFVKKTTGLRHVTRDDHYKDTGMLVERGLCSQLWIDPLINWDGTVYGCCAYPRGNFGNAFISGLPEILNGERMNYARDMLIGKKPLREDIPCARCPVYIRMLHDKTWIKYSQVKKRKWRRKLQAFFFEFIPSCMITKIVNLLAPLKTSL